MKKQTPSAILDGTLFYLDFENRQFVQSANTKNTIRFSGLEQQGDYFLLNYDTYQKAAADINALKTRPDHIKVITIHQEVLSSPEHVLDQVGFCTLHNQLSYQHDRNILLIDDAIGKRLKGRLPILDIADHPFYPDLMMRAIRPHDDFMNVLNFRDMYLYKNDQFQFFYEPATHRLVKLNDEELTELPSGIIGVYLPSEKQLDPIGYARLIGQPETSLLPNYPQRALMKAETRPLEKTWLGSELRRRNAERAAQAPKPIKKNVKRKGKGL